MRKKINPLIMFGFFGIMIFILILNRPRFEDHPVKTKSNIAQVESQALHNIDKPVIDVSGWQRLRKLITILSPKTFLGSSFVSIAELSP